MCVRASPGAWEEGVHSRYACVGSSVVVARQRIGRCGDHWLVALVFSYLCDGFQAGGYAESRIFLAGRLSLALSQRVFLWLQF